MLLRGNAFLGRSRVLLSQAHSAGAQDAGACKKGLRRRSIVTRKSLGVAVQPRTLIRANPRYRFQISDMLTRAGDRIEVKHVIEIYAEWLAESG